jgi:hypothetical protein
VTRSELAQEAAQPGDLSPQDVLPFMTPRATGAASAASVMTDANTRRIRTALDAGAERAPELLTGMAGWYSMSPMYQQLERLVGPGRAKELFHQFNQITAGMSPGSAVTTELNRGTAAHAATVRNAPDLFGQFANIDNKPDTPDWLLGVKGHAYHDTHQQGLEKFLREGNVLGSPKVGPYASASGVSGVTGRQSKVAVGDAHWSRGAGLAEVRGGKDPASSVTKAEIISLYPWWDRRIARPLGLEPVPAQAFGWGLFSGATGVDTPVGPPKLEILSDMIMDTANRLGMRPEEVRDRVLLGEMHLGQRKAPRPSLFPPR